MDEGLPVECTKKRGALEHECRTRLIGLCRLRQSLGGESKRKEGRKEKKKKKKRKMAVRGENGGAHRDRTDADGVAGTDGGDARRCRGNAPRSRVGPGPPQMQL